MTQRSELKQRYLETKAQLFGRLASKLFTYRKTGVDGLVKRILSPNKRQGSREDLLTPKRNG